jgi:hypothetical protein
LRRRWRSAFGRGCYAFEHRSRCVGFGPVSRHVVVGLVGRWRRT